MRYLQITTDTAAAATTTKETKYDPTSGHLKVKILNQPLDTQKLKSRRRRQHKPTPRSHLQLAITKRKKKVKIKQQPLDTSKSLVVHELYAHQGIRRFCFIFELLTAWGLEAHFEKVRKREKQNVNGAGDVQYVLLECLTAAWFYSMFCLRTKCGFGRTIGQALRGL